jgi:putative transcriptional regulator
VSERIALTASLDILRAMASGQGPQRAMLALGYSGWAPGQLDHEIQHNGWLHCDADEELLFGTDHDEKYAMALKKIGVDPAMLSGEAGHG